MFAERILERSISVTLRDLEAAGNLYIRLSVLQSLENHGVLRNWREKELI